MYAVPTHLLTRPFHRSEALAAGLTRDVVEGGRFVRLHESVYRHRDHAMSFDDGVAAARLALPAEARTTGITRLQELGLDYGPARPLRFVVQGDHHLALDGVFLHRTVKLPPCDAVGVCPEAAFVAYCAQARTIDAIKVGCALLRREWLDLDMLTQILVEERWRDGAREAAWVLPHLDGRCRSLPESELLTLLRFGGLPEPVVNQAVDFGGVVITPDLWWPEYRSAVEYEGAQHQHDRAQYTGDIDRYVVYRRAGADYRQVTRELLRLPRTTVARVHELLAARGYDGPPPEFGAHWDSLFRPLRDIVRPRIPRQR